jgi:hypothetical protein
LGFGVIPIFKVLIIDLQLKMEYMNKDNQYVKELWQRSRELVKNIEAGTKV